MKAVKNLIRAVAFLLIFFCLLSMASAVLRRKRVTGKLNYTAKLEEFYESEEDCYNYICIGSSHAFCTVNPLVIYEETKLPGFVLGISRQPLKVSYYYLKEAFKTQSPDVVILEGLMCGSPTAITDVAMLDALAPLRPSFNKLQMVLDCAPAKDWPTYLFDIIEYHDRWKEMSEKEFIQAIQVEPDYLKGFVCTDDVVPVKNQIPDYASVEAKPLTPDVSETLADILALTEEYGAKLVILIAPYAADSSTAAAGFKGLHEWAETNHVDVVDLPEHMGEVGLDGNEDYYDTSHLNRSGSTKASRYLSEYLKTLGMTTNPKTDDAAWQADYQRYLESDPKYSG